MNYLPVPVDYEIWTAGRSPTYRCEMRTVHGLHATGDWWYVFTIECCI